eukprot:CAMPEP_0183367036 /NCGR_PEP_ID=MMETSP0164_2-20130417/91056_1 /TAXON_ID=221442 /ORGANISM="Coccolithus pelagicus ssp braarudi, Strain PLY182g" /LENGTH=68 /DNA_ID=CAMNT_0025542913 /DNA_START=439 /DNA_END=645 /DNA_ORIENTATION=+
MRLCGYDVQISENLNPCSKLPFVHGSGSKYEPPAAGANVYEALVWPGLGELQELEEEGEVELAILQRF